MRIVWAKRRGGGVVIVAVLSGFGRVVNNGMLCFCSSKRSKCHLARRVGLRLNIMPRLTDCFLKPIDEGTF